MTVNRDKFLVNKTNIRTEFQIYWYHDSTCFDLYWPSSGFYNIEEESIIAVKTLWGLLI